MGTSLRPVLALLLVGGTLAVHQPAAHAAESTTILVTNQYGGSTCGTVNQQLLLVNPFTGSRTDLGTPNTSFGVFNEAKPFDLNRKIVALWGGSSDHNQLGGIGVYDRTVGAWTLSKALPTTIERGAESPHSIAVLPGGYFAVAHAGNVDGLTPKGFVIVLDPAGNVVNLAGSQPLVTAHGVEWDGQRNHLFAVGGMDVRKYSFNSSTGALTLVTTYPLPSSGGHDLRRRRVDNDYFLTTNLENYVFRPDAATKFVPLTYNSGAALPDYIKSMDQRFDGVTEFNQQGSTFRFLDGTSSSAGSCVSMYKGGRWLYAPGERVYPEDGTVPQTTWTPTFTVGGGANTWWIEIYASSDVVSLDVIGNNGQFFMSNVTKQTWGAFAQSPPAELFSGRPIKLIARKADGATAASTTFAWLTGTPATEPGWTATFTLTQCTSTKLDVGVTSGATTVEARIGTTTWAPLTLNATTGRYEKVPGPAAGSKVVVRAVRADGAKAYSPIYTC